MRIDTLTLLAYSAVAVAVDGLAAVIYTILINS